MRLLIVVTCFLLVSCGSAVQTQKEDLQQLATVKTWPFNPSFSDEKGLALLKAKLVEHSRYDSFEYTDSGMSGAHKRVDATHDDVSVYLHYTYHPRGDNTAYFAKSSVAFPYELVRSNDSAKVFIQSPSTFHEETTRGQLAVTEVKPFDTKTALLQDASDIFQSIAQTALKRRVDGDGIQKYMALSPDFVAFELYVTTGCQVVVNQTEPSICPYEGVLVEAWVSTKGLGSELIIDFYQEYIVQGADMLALDAALSELDNAQEIMLQTLDLPLTD